MTGGDFQSISRLFPRDDRYWTQALEAAQAMIAPGETVCAHEYFLGFFPGALPYLALGEGTLAGVDWIIFHKDAVGHPRPGALRMIRERFAPVFANEVFVLLAGARVAGRAVAERREFDPIHVEALWVKAAQIEESRRGTDGKNIVDTLLELRGNRDAWPAGEHPVEEAGIVISASNRFFKELHANLSNIRARGCRLPVEVWHLPGEFTAKQKAVLGGMARFVEECNTPFDGLSGRHEVHGFKAWMLARSRFRRTLMLDVNSFPLTDLGTIFATSGECILWPDAPWGCCAETSSQLRRTLGIPAHGVEFESGQLYVDKTSAPVRDALRLAAAMNALGRPLYDYTYGDKETYSIAFDLLGVPYRIAPLPAIDPPGAGDHLDTVVIQRWLDNSPLFYHALGMKRNHWARLGGEWVALEKEAAEAEAACA